LENYFGEIAALATALCWSLTSTCFTIGGRRVGSVILNRTRLVFALIFLSITHYIIYGSLIPLSAEPDRWLWLGLSGVIGFALGDACLFQAFVMVGAHISMLLMSLVPIISTVIAWVFLGETLSLVELLAITITVSGVCLVVLTKGNSHKNSGKKDYFKGILFGFGGAMGQAIGLVLSKKGLYGEFPGLSATLIRVIAGVVTIWIITALTGKVKQTVDKMKDKRAFITILCGAFVGPFLGVWLSMVAIKYAYIGIASTLMALPPVLLIPISYWVFKEKITLLSVLGTIIAVLGTAFIFLT